MNNTDLINYPRKVHELPGAKCVCRIDLPASGLARNLLSEWLRDHPVHIRKEHLLAKDIFKWFGRRLNGRRSKCFR